MWTICCSTEVPMEERQLHCRAWWTLYTSQTFVHECFWGGEIRSTKRHFWSMSLNAIWKFNQIAMLWTFIIKLFVLRSSLHGKNYNLYWKITPMWCLRKKNWTKYFSRQLHTCIHAYVHTLNSNTGDFGEVKTADICSRKKCSWRLICLYLPYQMLLNWWHI